MKYADYEDIIEALAGLTGEEAAQLEDLFNRAASSPGLMDAFNLNDFLIKMVSAHIEEDDTEGDFDLSEAKEEDDLSRARDIKAEMGK